MMGIFDLVGTTASGWLTDRFDPRKLLFMYYGLRGLSLIFLPYSDFSFYRARRCSPCSTGWTGSRPCRRPCAEPARISARPTRRSCSAGSAAGHQMGAASAATFAGVMRSWQGNYLQAFIIAGATGIIAAVVSLLIHRPGRTANLQPAVQAA